MESQNQDIWLWMGLGILGYCAAHAAHRQLLAVRTASQISQDNKPQDILSQRTENALKLETLGQLTQSANQDIRAAAVKIITERAKRGAGLEIMLQDIAGQDIERRDKALTSLCYLCASPTVGFGMHKALTPSYAMFKVIIDCLCTWLPGVQNSESAMNNDDFPYRSQPERNALKILGLLLQHEVTLGLQAGLIFRWLANYHFDNRDVSETRRKQAISEMLKWEYDDFSMCTIVNALYIHDQAREELESHGLLDSTAMEVDILDDAAEIEDIWLVRHRSGIEIDGGPDSTPMMRRGQRVREESIEEEALRRRRREAMVLGQDGRAVERDDIIERDNVLSDENAGQREAIDEFSEAPARGEPAWWNWRPWSVLSAGLVEEF